MEWLQASAVGAWRVALLAVVVVGLLERAPARAESGNLGPETLSLPGGAASARGLGTGFTAGDSMGTGGFALPIEVPPGIMMPELSLEYAAGSGSGVVGMSFDLPVTQIYRRTDHGSPDFDEQDLFAVSGPSLQGDLVRIDASRGLYRLRKEGDFALFVRDAASDSWTIRLPDGGAMRLGTRTGSRETSRGRSYRWLVDEEEDSFRHQVAYRYRSDGGRLYLHEVSYQGDTLPSFRNRVALLYEARPDASTDYAYGAARTTALRLSAIEIYHGQRRVSRYALRYREALLFSLLESVSVEGEHGEQMPPLKLAYVEPSPDRGSFVTMRELPPLEGLVDGRAALVDVNQDGLTDILSSFMPGSSCAGYHYYENLDGRQFAEAPRCLEGGPDQELNQVDVRLMDVDADGDRDVVTGVGPTLRAYRIGPAQRGVVPGFESVLPLETDYEELHAGHAAAELADLNQDGRTDLLYQKPGSPVVLLTRPDGRLVDEVIPPLPMDVDLTDPRSSLDDFNGDGVLDLVLRGLDFGQNDVRVWYGVGHGDFLAEEQHMAGVPSAASEELFLEDVNRDGQTDLIQVSGTWANYYLNDGRGRFRGPIAEFRNLPSAWETSRLLFADMNGNGSVDLVWLTVDHRLQYRDLLGAPHFGLLRRIDNGIGMVMTVEYASSTDHAIRARRAGAPWSTPLPNPVPVVAAVETTDSLGLLGAPASVKRVEYEYRDGYYDGPLRSFRGFGRVTVREQGDQDHEGLIHETHYHLGRTENGELRDALQGLAYLEVYRGEDGQILASEETRWEARLLCQEDLGSAWPTPILPRCATVRNPLLARDALVVLPVRTLTVSGSFERTNAPRYSAEASTVDAFGQVTLHRELGEVRFPRGHVLGRPLELGELEDVSGDERTTETRYVEDGTRWMIGLPAEEKVRDGAGNLVAQTRTYYDGEPLQGLALGRVGGHGLVTRTSAWLRYVADGASEERWVDTSRIAYNGDGLPTTRISPDQGRIELRYDEPTRMLIVEERRTVGPRTLVFAGTYDSGTGMLLTAVDANGVATRYRYDGLKRLTAVYDAASSEERPVGRFSYVTGTADYPLSKVITEALVDRERGTYHRVEQLVDGLGRTRLTRTDAEDPYGTIASGWVRYSSRGAPVESFEPYAVEGPGLEFPPAGTASERTRLDALDRPVAVYAPYVEALGPAHRSFEYRPFETVSHDERDNAQDGGRFPHVDRFDGLGGLRETVLSNEVAGARRTLRHSYERDALGQIVAVLSPESDDGSRVRRTYRYDTLGRLRELLDPELGMVRYEYDDAGRMTRRVDALGQEQHNTYDEMGRVLARSLRHDAGGRPDVTYRFHYDAADASGPLPGAQYLVGRLAWIESPIGATHLSYDDEGRVERTVELLWDPTTSPFDSQTRTRFEQTFQYSPQGEMLRETLPGDFEIGYELDRRRQVRTIRTRVLSGVEADADSAVFARIRYAPDGKPLALERRNRTRTCLQYDARGSLIGDVSGRTSDTRCGSDAAAEQGPRGILSLRYRRTYDGLLEAVADSSPGPGAAGRLDATYGYDPLGQLTFAATAGQQYRYDYDAQQGLRVRTTSAEGAGTVVERYRYGEGGAGPHALTSVCRDPQCQGDPDQRLRYDAAGRLEAYRGYRLEYDVDGQLASAVKEDGAFVRFHYDHAGQRRIVEYGRGDTTERVERFVFDGYTERDGDPTWQVSGPHGRLEVIESAGVRIDPYLLDGLVAYVNGASSDKPLPAEYLDLDGDGDGPDADDLRVAMEAMAAESRAGGSRRVERFEHVDQLGSVVRVSDRDGDVVARSHYEPYGRELTRAGWSASHGFADAVRDADASLGLVRFGARYYAPALGRWITPDPYIGQSPEAMAARPLEANLYGYVGADPVNRVDPTGLFALALGLNDGLTEFALSQGALTYRTALEDESRAARWRSRLLGDAATPDTIDDAVGEMISEATSIQFKVDGLDWGRFSRYVKSGGNARSNHTNFELRTIGSDPDLLAKTTFHRDGEDVTDEIAGRLNRKFRPAPPAPRRKGTPKPSRAWRMYRQGNTDPVVETAARKYRGFTPR